jgi:hypothetical protein
MNEFNITIVFDSLPLSELSPNSRVHWRKRAELVAQERAYGKIRGNECKGDWQAPAKAIMSFKFYVKNKRLHDLDNLISSCKARIDGLRDAGILKADDCWHLSYGSAEVILAKQDETWLEIREI